MAADVLEKHPGFKQLKAHFWYSNEPVNWHRPDAHEHKTPTFAWSNDLLLLIHVVLVALDVAAPALQSRWRLEHVPQRFGAGLTVGGEMVEGGDKLVTFVADVAGLLTDGLRKLWFLFALAFVCIKNLIGGRK